MGLFDFFTTDIAIDLGTANTLIMYDDEVVVNEPSIVAVDRMTGKVIAVGTEAQQMHEKTHEKYRTVRPLRDGVIADFTVAEHMIRKMIGMIPRKSRLFATNYPMIMPAKALEKRRNVRINAHGLRLCNSRRVRSAFTSPMIRTSRPSPCA